MLETALLPVLNLIKCANDPEVHPLSRHVFRNFPVPYLCFICFVVITLTPTPKYRLQESCASAKMTAQCALHMGALKIFGTP